MHCCTAMYKLLYISILCTYVCTYIYVYLSTVHSTTCYDGANPINTINIWINNRITYQQILAYDILWVENRSLFFAIVYIWLCIHLAMYTIGDIMTFGDGGDLEDRYCSKLGDLSCVRLTGEGLLEP